MISLYVIDDHFLIGSGFSSVFDPETDNINIAGYSLNVHDAIPDIKQIIIILLNYLYA
jgi:hypothetical protein